MFNKKDFGKRIRSARKSKGLSQENLGNAIGKNASTIGRYENGDILPDAEQISLICDELGINEYELLIHLADF
jgi:transcriptional regulator with XRE-family HTH domain